MPTTVARPIPTAPFGLLEREAPMQKAPDILFYFILPNYFLILTQIYINSQLTLHSLRTYYILLPSHIPTSLLLQLLTPPTLLCLLFSIFVFSFLVLVV